MYLQVSVRWHQRHSSSNQNFDKSLTPLSLHDLCVCVCVCVCVCDVEAHELHNFSDWVEREHDHGCSLETF